MLAPMDRTLPAMLRSADPERKLVTVGDTTWTVADACRIAATRGGSLRDAGVRRGDPVAALCGNGSELLELVLGCGWIGAVLVPINTAAMGPQIGYYLRNCGARLLAVEHRFLNRLMLAGTLPVERVWVVGGDGLSDGLMEPFPGPADPADAEFALSGDPFAVLYTSGTTGPSKGVICPHAQYYWWGANSAALLEVEADDVLCTTLPMFHINALNTLAQALLTGAHMVLESRFSASGFWSAMAARGATVVYLLGAMVPILLAQPVTQAERAHRVRRGLGPGVPADLMTAFSERTGVSLVDGYGSTETNFVIGETVADRKPGAMGRIRPGFEAQVVDELDNPLPAGVPGELVLRAREPFSFASGYLGMADKTVEAWRNLWFHTGDRVARDEDGWFRFVDRLKDVIRRRGENISSHEVEQVLLSHPDVEAAAAFPVASDLAEDEVMVALVIRPGQPFDPVALMGFCEARMPHFAVPRYVEVLADLPRTENGKIQKFKLRERGVTAGTWDREAAGYVVRRR
ncbi:ATP-dependent acyl-CoA ligase [Acidisphaera sp. S103]|uniref:ATP-dependent acyl-CoA ligase n=1 Tax=Acidisphaera sp. S103 TaxID=1747223 RepID=UPI00131CD88B|nr:ATP-dependent acyl-CoA ligase [Acidisphaera sp. S103]